MTTVECGDARVLRLPSLGGVAGHSLPSSLLNVRSRARRLSEGGLATDSRWLCDRERVGEMGSSDHVANAATSETDTEVRAGVGDALTPSGNVIEQTLPRRDRLGVDGHTAVSGLDKTGALGRPTICEWRRLSRSGSGGSTNVPTPGTAVMVTVDWARRRERSSFGAGAIHDQRRLWLLRSSALSTSGGKSGGGGMRADAVASSARVGSEAAEEDG